MPAVSPLRRAALASAAALLAVAAQALRGVLGNGLDARAWQEQRGTLTAGSRPQYRSDAEFCNIPRVEAAPEEFLSRIMGTGPVILTNGAGNAAFRNLTSRASLLERFPDLVVTLSSANSYSYAKRRVSLRRYLETMTGDASLERRGNATFYLFGDTVGKDWDKLLAHFVRPQWEGGARGALSFGVAGRHSGVPFHTHGPVFADLQHGRKRWFLYPPSATVRFDPDRSQWQWLHEVYPALGHDDAPLECTARAGETLYIPAMWWHATLNLSPHTVFVSTFTEEPDPAAGPDAANPLLQRQP